MLNQVWTGNKSTTNLTSAVQVQNTRQKQNQEQSSWIIFWIKYYGHSGDQFKLANAQTIATYRNHANMSQLQQSIAKIMVKSAYGTLKEMLKQTASKWN